MAIKHAMAYILLSQLQTPAGTPGPAVHAYLSHPGHRRPALALLVLSVFWPQSSKLVCFSTFLTQFLGACTPAPSWARVAWGGPASTPLFWPQSFKLVRISTFLTRRPGAGATGPAVHAHVLHSGRGRPALALPNISCPGLRQA